MPSPLHHLVQGSGPAVVLLHAGVADLRMWEAQATALAPTHRVIRCDLRGFGQTPLAPGRPYADGQDVIDLLDELDVDTFALVGASYGGGVALQVASTVPERVTRLVLLAAAADLVEPTAAVRAFGAEENRLLEAGDVAGATDLNVQTWAGPDADPAARELLREMQARAFEVQLAAGDDVDNRDLDVVPELLTMPMTVVYGAHDLDFFAATARELVRLVPSATLVELDWAGHLPALERPEATTDLLRAALA
ncbi:MAG: alpha/beta hydrolase [Sporichthyaceae bacterium]